MICVICGHYNLAQNQYSKWYFGSNAGLDFMTSPPTPISGSMITFEGCSAISDNNGNLLFYTDGSTIWNQNHNVMPNGNGLGGNSSTTQSSNIVKQPGNSNIYFVFSLSDGGNGTLRYSVVDMSLAAGLGSVTASAILISTNNTEKMTSLRHCNGIDYWLLCCPAAQGSLNAYQVTAAGVNTTAVGSSLPNLIQGWVGNMKTSPNGRKIAFANNYVTASFDLCDFDIATGIASNEITISNNGGYGVEFSPDGTKLYGTNWNQAVFYQWDLCAGNAQAIANSVYSMAPAVPLCGMQLATDGKIYIAKSGVNTLAVINNPNNSGAACNFQQVSNFTLTSNCRANLPNFISSDFNPPPGFTYTVANCSKVASFITTTGQNSYQINPCSPTPTSSAILWDFGDPGSGLANTSTLTTLTHSFTNIGTYSVSLISYNANMCTGTNDTILQLITIPFCVSVQSQSITCSSLGSATVTAQNGIGPFNYTWMPSGQTTSVATGLNPGTHTLIAYDFGTNLTYSTTTTFTPPSPYTGTLSNSPSSLCGGTNTGTASIVVSGGSGNQTYLWTGPTGVQTNSIATGLNIGNHAVTVTDALTSCTVTQVFTLGPPPPSLSLILLAVTPSVCAGTSVSVLAFPFGGIPIQSIGYTYTWTNGPNTYSYAPTPLSAGNHVYTVTISDANNCTLSGVITVTAIANPILALNSVSICPQQSGTLSASGASTYSWSTGLTTSSITDSPLATTVYTVTGTAQTCSSMATASIVVNAVPVPTLSSNSPICSGKILNLFANGGTTYTWSGPATFSSPLQNPQINFSSVNNSGVYTVTLTSANSCTAPAAITVTVNQTPTLSASGSTVCTTQTINLIANANAAITYTWAGPGGYTSSMANPVITNPAISASGVYSVWVTAANGCTNTAAANVTVSGLPNPSFTSNSPQCEGSALNFNSSASSGSMVYSWTGPNGFTSSMANPQIPNLSPAAAGVYTLTLIEGPCAVDISNNVIVFTNPVPLITHNAPLCATKTLSMAVNTVCPLYQWTGPLSFTASTQSLSIVTVDLSHSGNYSVVVTDSNTCQGMASVSISVMPNPTLTVSGANVCYGDAAIINASGAATYTWSGPNGFNAYTEQAIISAATNTLPFTYYVIGMGMNTCTTVANVQVSTKTLPSAGASLTARACVNTPIYFNGEGGITYQWTGPLGFSNSQQNFSTTVNNPTMAGNYTLMVTDAEGCKGYKSVTLITDEVPRGNLWRDNTQNCVPFCSDFKYVGLNAPIVESYWQINGQTFATDTFNYCFSTAGDYTLQGNFTDSRTCKNSLLFVVNAYPVPQAEFDYFPQEVIEGNEIRFESTSTGTGIEGYNWYFANNNPSGINRQSVQHIFPEPGVYPVAMVINNKWGCKDTLVKAISVSEDYQLYVPNAFTPNGDNSNENFYAVGRGVKTFSILIFNRWGQLLYQSTDITAGWDGTFKGEPCKEDVYTWQIEAKSIRGKEEKLSGSVLLYR